MTTDEKVNQFNKKMKEAGMYYRLIHRLEKFNFKELQEGQMTINIRSETFDPTKEFFYFNLYNDVVSLEIKNLHRYIILFTDWAEKI